MDSQTNGILLSIVVPFYNGKKYINKTVKALLDIRCSKEILIVNDGSNEENRKFLEDLVLLDPSLIIYNKENGGIVSSRNYGLNKATGKYLLFIDQDDTPDAETITEAVNILEKSNTQLIIWSTDIINEYGVISPFTRVANNCQLRKEDIINGLLPTLLYSRPGRLISDLGQIWAILFRREFVVSNGISFKRFIDYEDDNIFILDTLCNAECITLIKEVGYQYFVRSDSYSRGIKHYSCLYDRLKLFNTYYLQKYDSVCSNQKEVENYKFFLEQKSLYKLLANYAVRPEARDKEDLKSGMKESKIAFKRGLLLPKDKLTTFFYWCIKIGFPYLFVFAYRIKLRKNYGKWTVKES